LTRQVLRTTMHTAIAGEDRVMSNFRIALVQS
jgi:hypothetical protein